MLDDELANGGAERQSDRLTDGIAIGVTDHVAIGIAIHIADDKSKRVSYDKPKFVAERGRVH